MYKSDVITRDDGMTRDGMRDDVMTRDGMTRDDVMTRSESMDGIKQEDVMHMSDGMTKQMDIQTTQDGTDATCTRITLVDEVSHVA